MAFGEDDYGGYPYGGFAFAMFGRFALPASITHPASVWQRDLVISASNYRTSVYRRPLAAATALSATQSWTTSTPAKSHLVVFKDVVEAGDWLAFF